MNPVIVIAGPTASGKSAISLQIARKARERGITIEIISMDSALVYSGMDIGTAKPSIAELTEFTHHGINLCEPNEPYSAAHFAKDAHRWIDEIQQRGHVPLIVGGTMLYWRALAHGLSDIPSSDPDVRFSIEKEALDVGWPAMHDQLGLVDAPTAARLQKNDSQRISRALEIYRQTGKPMSEWLQSQPKESGRHDDAASPNFRLITLEPSDRQVLHQRIAQRFDQMLAHGFLEEMRLLHANPHLHSDLPAMRAVAYRQGWQYLEGEITLEDFREKTIAATRQLAKRQLTWLRAIQQKEVFDPLSEPSAEMCVNTCLASYGIN